MSQKQQNVAMTEWPRGQIQRSTYFFPCVNPTNALNFIMAVNATLKETEEALGWAYISIITVNISLIKRTLLGSFGWFCLSVKVERTINKVKSLKIENFHKQLARGELRWGGRSPTALSVHLQNAQKDTSGWKGVNKTRARLKHAAVFSLR